MSFPFFFWLFLFQPLPSPAVEPGRLVSFVCASTCDRGVCWKVCQPNQVAQDHTLHTSHKNNICLTVIRFHKDAQHQVPPKCLQTLWWVRLKLKNALRGVQKCRKRRTPPILQLDA